MSDKDQQDPRVDILAEALDSLPPMGHDVNEMQRRYRRRARDILARLDAARPASPAPEHATPDEDATTRARVWVTDVAAGRWPTASDTIQHAPALAALAALPAPAAPDRDDFPVWPWDPEPFVEAVDSLQAKVIEHCGDSESYIGTQGPEAIEDACRDLVVFAEKARDLMPEPFVTPVVADRIACAAGEEGASS